MRVLLQRQVLNPINPFRRIAGLRNQLKVGDTPTDCHSSLRSVDHANKAAAGSLPRTRFGQQILILCEKYTA